MFKPRYFLNCVKPRDAMPVKTTISNGPDSADVTFILAHGAGAGMDTPFMNQISEGLAGEGAKVIRFEFPYMKIVRETGKRRPPDKAEKLISSFIEVIKANPSKQLIIGGKSMGGRMASIIAADEDQVKSLNISGCVCLGYPFHPPNKPDKLRLDHFSSLKIPTLICQGERDVFGTKNEVNNYNLPKNVELCWLKDGDHSFKPRKKSGVNSEHNIATAKEHIARKFIA